MVSSLIPTLLAFASTCSAFSAISPPAIKASSVASPSGGGGLFANRLAEFKRTSLKKQLIKAAEAKDESLVMSLVDELAAFNPTDFATYGLGGFGGGSGEAAPLNGEWRLLYTNAQDAEAPARTEKQTGGDAVAEGVQVTTGQRIDAAKGECVNFIKLSGDSPKRPFDELEITIKMTALTPTRVRLDFQRGRAQNERAPFEFLKDVTFRFPPAIVGDVLSRFRGKDPSIEPSAYFDVLYIDQQIRAHRTGEGKIFVQMRGR